SQAGVELACDGSNAVQVAAVTSDGKLDSPKNIGHGGTVLPLSSGSGPSDLVLYQQRTGDISFGPDDAATCVVRVGTYGADPIRASGPRELQVPQDVRAVSHPIALGQDAALVVGDR